MTPQLQKLFVRRLDVEMKARGLSGNGLASLAKRHGIKLGQRSVARILAGEQDPSLAKLEAIAYVLGLPAWALLTDQAEERVIRPPTVEKTSTGGVLAFPNLYPKVFRKTPTEEAKISRSKAKKR